MKERGRGMSKSRHTEAIDHQHGDDSTPTLPAVICETNFHVPHNRSEIRTPAVEIALYSATFGPCG